MCVGFLVSNEQYHEHFAIIIHSLIGKYGILELKRWYLTCGHHLEVVEFWIVVMMRIAGRLLQDHKTECYANGSDIVLQCFSLFVDDLKLSYIAPILVY